MMYEIKLAVYKTHVVMWAPRRMFRRVRKIEQSDC